MGVAVLITLATLTFGAVIATPPKTIAQSVSSSGDLDAEPVEDYLESHGLQSLMVTYLEEELHRALGVERIPIAEQLATMYGRLFDDAATSTERDEWTQKSLDLVKAVPEVDTPELRLSLAKAKYLRAESIAERYRLHAADHAEMLTARRMMTEASATFENEFRSYQGLLRRIEGSSIRPGDQQQAKETADQLKELDRLASQSAYYAAWSNYYAGWLKDSNDDLNEALHMFGWVLEGSPIQPAVEAMPRTLLNHEHVARAALGTALALSALDRSTSALKWLDALEEPQTHPGVKAQLTAYRLWIYFEEAEHQLSSRHPVDWQRIESFIEHTHANDEMTPVVARLLAVLSLQIASQNPRAETARSLAGDAIGYLSVLNQLAVVLEIAEEFDLEVLGKNSFSISYVLALQAYDRARSTHGSDTPTQDRALVNAYKEAINQLVKASSRRDANKHKSAASNARFLAAWAHYFSSDFAQAAKVFLAVAPLLERPQQETAGWMRIVCLDRLTKIETSDTSREHLQAALQSFLEEFPSSQRSGRVRYQLVLLDKDGEPTLEKIETLLQIPVSSDAYSFAQRAAEQMLYSLVRRGKGMERVNLSHRYLAVALPLLNDVSRKVFLGSTDAATRLEYTTYTRRTLEILLSRGVARISEARKILDRLRTSSASGLMDLSAFDVELHYRDFQIVLLSGKYADATAMCSAMWDADSEGRFARAAMRELIARDLQDFHAFPNDTGSTEALVRILTFGQRLRETLAEPIDLQQSEPLTLLAAIAEASFALYQRQPEEDNAAERLDEARRLYATLVEAHPSNFLFLRANAQIAAIDNQPEKALTHWREALKRLNGQDPRWFEAKYALIQTLATVDVQRAIAVIEQHELLNPSYGPSPWGERLRSLAQSIRQQQNQSATQPLDTDSSTEGEGGQ